MATLLRGGIALLFVAMGYYVMCLLEKLESSRELSYIWYFLSAMAFALVNWIAISVNGGVDLRYMTFNNSALYFCGAFSGSMAVVCLCRTLPALKLLSYLGTNSLIIMVTHLDCFVMYIALKFADFMSQMIPFGKEFILWLCTALALFFMEIIIIYIVNHFFPFFWDGAGGRNRILTAFDGQVTEETFSIPRNTSFISQLRFPSTCSVRR